MKTVLCLGDSNTYGYDPRSYAGSRYPENIRWTGILKRKGYHVINHGYPGETVPRRFEGAEADILIVMYGTNDLLNGDTPEHTAEKMKHFLQTLPETEVILASVPLMKPGTWVSDERIMQDVVKLNELLKGIADDLHIMFADSSHLDLPLCFDGVHFTEEGHALFADNILKYL